MSVVDRCTDSLPLIRHAHPNGPGAWDESKKIRQGGEPQARAMEGAPARLHRVLVQEAFQEGSPGEHQVGRANGEGEGTKAS